MICVVLATLATVFATAPPASAMPTTCSGWISPSNGDNISDFDATVSGNYVARRGPILHSSCHRGFTYTSGTKVRVTHESNGYYYVKRTSDGDNAWISTRAFQTTTPAPAAPSTPAPAAPTPNTPAPNTPAPSTPSSPIDVRTGLERACDAGDVDACRDLCRLGYGEGCRANDDGGLEKEVFAQFWLRCPLDGASGGDTISPAYDDRASHRAFFALKPKTGKVEAGITRISADSQCTHSSFTIQAPASLLGRTCENAQVRLSAGRVTAILGAGSATARRLVGGGPAAAITIGTGTIYQSGFGTLANKVAPAGTQISQGVNMSEVGVCFQYSVGIPGQAYSHPVVIQADGDLHWTWYFTDSNGSPIEPTTRFR